jgi:hypothetical protein
VNEIAAENSRLDGVTGREGWDFGPDFLDPDLVGFASPFSIDRFAPGNSIDFKLRTNYPLAVSIFRLGYYGGAGARLIQRLNGASLDQPQPQPICLWVSQSETVDCSNWVTSVQYTHDESVPSGFFMAHCVTVDGPNAGKGRLVPFLVRDDSRESAVLMQVADLTWQAYNLWSDVDHPPRPGIGAFYSPTDQGGVLTRVHFERPLSGNPSGPDTEFGFTMFWRNTFPVLQWLERLGVGASYTTGQAVAQDYVDTQREPAASALLPSAPDRARLFMTVGHDEYWSQAQRTNVERARMAGVHMAYLSGNQMFWKVDWDGPDTIVCDKQSNKVPRPGVTQSSFTGLWQDDRVLAGDRIEDAIGPENLSTGTISAADGHRAELLVAPGEGAHRFWRGTAFAGEGSWPYDMHEFTHEAVGHEWNEDLNNGCRPPGLVHLSSTPTFGTSLNFGSGDPARGQDGGCTSTHHLTLFRDTSSGAIIFDAATIEFGQALDTSSADDLPRAAMSRAMVNLFADMGLTEPDTLPSPDWWDPPDARPAGPGVEINEPLSPVMVNELVRMAGIAAAAQGAVVCTVELSWDDGRSWVRATGRDQWHRWWAPPHSGTFVIRCRATDDWGSVQEGAPFTIEVAPAAGFPTSSGDYAPLWPDISEADCAFQPDTTEVEIGAHFMPNVDGYFDGIRFLRGADDNGPHAVSLWRWGERDWTLLATAAIASGTSSGWTHVPFRMPVPAIAEAHYIASIRSETGFLSLTTPPIAINPDIVFERPGYSYANRDEDGFVTPGHSAAAGAAIEQAPGFYYPVEPLFRPAASARYTIWPTNGVSPRNAHQQQNTRVELGSLFSAAVDGYIVAIRFCNPTDLPTWKVQLWDTELPDCLATATSASVQTSKGWQEIPLDTAFPVLADHHYIASYTSPAPGVFAFSSDYAQIYPAVSWPLRWIKGVYGLDASRPDKHFAEGSTYFVDVVFRTRTA